MDLLDQFLKRKNKRLSDLNNEEIDFYNRASQAINQKPPTILEQIEIWDSQIESLIAELCNTRTDDRIDTYLKARLKNAFIIKQSLTAGDKARKSLAKILERQNA